MNEHSSNIVAAFDFLFGIFATNAMHAWITEKLGALSHVD